jgi:hypothetical protein
MSEDRARVRELARRVAEIAASDGMAAIRRRWRDVNALRKPDRAPVWCRPVGAWEELLPEASLQCADPWLRSIERVFRQALIKHDIGDDSPVEPWFEVGAVFDWEPWPPWGLAPGRHQSDAPGGAWAYDPPLKTREDFDRLRLPSLTYNPTRTQEALDRAHALLGDLLPVRRVCDAPLSATLGTAAAELRGLTELMLDAAAEPELLHRLMAHLRDGTLQAMRQVAAAGVLTPNNTGPMTCSDPIGAPAADGTFGYGNLWASANSQEFDQVSPAMWEEFCLRYQMPILAQFGLTAYGCCENLTHKIDGVLTIPNLRIFVCSAWTDLNAVMERVGRRYVVMWRQKASDVVFSPSAERLRRDLEDGARRLQGCRYQIVLRELQTLAGHPDRLREWTRLAIEAAERWA